MDTIEVSVVVPCFDEGEVISTFHHTLLAVLEESGSAFEICYVDDGSRDSTRAQLRDLTAADRRVRYTSFSRNFGKEAAMLAGLRMTRGEAVALMDADLQHPPQLLPRMLQLRRQGYDQVVARRDRSGEGTVRHLLTSGYYRAMGHGMDVEVVDGEGDFRLLSRSAVDAVLALPEANRFSKGIFSWIGFDTVSFTYRNVSRAAGCSKWGGRRLLNYGIDGLISFNNRPLRLVIYAGLTLCVAAFAYALWIITDVALNGVELPGFATLITVVLALGGIQLATLGIIGEYVGRIYSETKRRPHYVVRETERDRLRGRDVREDRAPPAAEPSRGRVPRRAGFVTSRTVRQFFTFAAIGIVNTAVYLSVYVLLNRWIPYLIAHVIGFAVSVVGSFLLNTYITCRSRPTWAGFIRYPLSSVVNLVFSGVLLFLGVDTLGLGKNIAAVIAGLLATPLSFLLARWAITSGAARATSSHTSRMTTAQAAWNPNDANGARPEGRRIDEGERKEL
ncbi:glycosyltransferase [Streptomyces sp. NPDC057889]|uniref:glycosyltransferase n=1 Tax=unclassified Streptomyces TaxID=2593676 RepID=UPI0036A1F3DD